MDKNSDGLAGLVCSLSLTKNSNATNAPLRPAAPLTLIGWSLFVSVDLALVFDSKRFGQHCTAPDPWDHDELLFSARF